MPFQIMVNMFAVLFALLSSAGIANAQEYVPGDSGILVSGDAPLVNKFEKDLKLPKGCQPWRFDDTQDVLYGKQGGVLVACKSGDAANGYVAVAEAFLKTLEKDKPKQRLGMARTILHRCTDMQEQQCQTWPCAVRVTKDQYYDQYFFGCFDAGGVCQAARQCTKKQ